MAEQIYGHTEPGLDPAFIAATRQDDGTIRITVRSAGRDEMGRFAQACITLEPAEAARLSDALHGV